MLLLLFALSSSLLILFFLILLLSFIGIVAVVVIIIIIIIIKSFDSNDYGLLVIDPKNAFNTINRSALLWNIRILWPRASTFIFNTYRGWSSLILKGSHEHLYSMEGVVQGDPLSMFIYAAASLPLIKQLEDNDNLVTQIWYADDSYAVGDLSSIRCWLDKLSEIDPYYGYYPEPKKSNLLVKSSLLSQAQQTFEGTGIQVVLAAVF